MPHPSPSRAGFDAVVRRPAVLLAEVCWRWCFGITSLTLLAATAILFLGTIRVSDAEMQLAKSGSPWVAADVVARLLQANWAPLLRAAAVLVPGIAILWTLASGFGRMVTLPPLLASVSLVSGGAVGNISPPKARLSSLFALSFLRAAVVLAVIGAYFAIAFIAGWIAAQIGGGPDQVMSAFMLVFLPLFLLALLAAGLLFWILGIAPVFAVRDGTATTASITAVFGLCRSNPREFLAISSGYSIARLIAIAVVTFVSLVLCIALNATLAVVAVVILSLLYFAFADLLCLARLAAYAALDQPVPPASVPNVVFQPAAPSPQA